MSQSAEETLGSVVSLWRYPVKSMMGEELNAAEVGERGLLGDHADVHESLSRALEREVKLEAAERGQREVVESSFPNTWAPRAEEYWPDMEGLEHRDTVTDFDLPEGTFFDCAVIHVLTTATLDRLRELYPQGRFEVRRFRPN